MLRIDKRQKSRLNPSHKFCEPARVLPVPPNTLSQQLWKPLNHLRSQRASIVVPRISPSKGMILIGRTILRHAKQSRNRQIQANAIRERLARPKSEPPSKVVVMRHDAKLLESPLMEFRHHPQHPLTAAQDWVAGLARWGRLSKLRDRLLHFWFALSAPGAVAAIFRLCPMATTLPSLTRSASRWFAHCCIIVLRSSRYWER